MAWVSKQYQVPLNAEGQYNHLLALNGLTIDDLSFNSSHARAIYKLVLTSGEKSPKILPLDYFRLLISGMQYLLV